MKKLHRYRIGELPILHEIVERMNLRETLYEFFPKHKNEKVPVVETLILLIYNLTIGKIPLYELESWIKTLDFRSIGLQKYCDIQFSDDRFGNALDKLYKADRASLMTKIVLNMVDKFKINLDQIHNDSTSIKACGNYSGVTNTGVEFKKGHSKDHRPDLKQLIFSLSISKDGAVPIHFKTYSGNRNDETTHIETWNTICKITSRCDFIYVADCKVCTDSQLSHITENGGRVITVIPEYWNEIKAFKKSLREKAKEKKEIHRRRTPDGRTEYFFTYSEKCYTKKRGYRIHWILSSERKKQDHAEREANLKSAENKLSELYPKLNRWNLKTREGIQKKCEQILKKYEVSNFINISIDERKEEYIVKRGRGRKGGNAKYETIVNNIYTLSYLRDKKALKREENIDGIYPLLSTDEHITAKEGLFAYKYQPKIEKRFSQLKSIHKPAPIFLKSIERVEANMFLFFISLIIQSITEREIRKKMKRKGLKSLEIYPENRDATHPTTAKVFDIFSSISTYSIIEEGDVVEEYRDELTDVQRTILELLNIDQDQYWNCDQIA